MNSPRTLFAAVAVVGLVALGACGDTDDDEGGAPPETTAADPSPSGASGDAVDCADGPGETVTVEIGDFVFAPEPVEVSACDEIVWTNAHDQAHTSTANGDVSWSTGNIAPGDQADPIRFDTPGAFSYVCALHPFMEGTVEVS